MTASRRAGRTRLAPLAALLGVVALIGVFDAWRVRSARTVQMSPEVAEQLAAGERYVDRIAARARSESGAPLGDGEVLVLGYLERLRLGLGSPFRLVEQALRDPMLPDSARTPLAWALLRRTLIGDSYQLETAALTSIGLEGTWRAGDEHRAIVDSVVLSAADPRAGELAVRLAYRLAAASGTVHRRAPWVAAHAAAAVRDRVLASRDARALLAAALVEESDPLPMVLAWRAARRFAVERPVLLAPPASVERAALDEVQPLLARIDSATTHERADTARAPEPEPRRTMSMESARRLATVAARRGAPPQAPVSVIVESVGGERGPRATSTARLRFLQRSTNEETLAAEYALLSARDPRAASDAPVAVLWASTALRSLAQEPVWFPGDGGPTVPELKDRLGLAAISFDDSLPSSWRPYYLRMLAMAVADMQRVIPTLSVKGLGVHFGESPMRRSALAMHDPGKRTIFVPPSTGGGVLAHELAHDLDWQAARRRYGARGAYSTDRAMRMPNDRLAASMRALTGAEPGVGATTGGEITFPGSRRPTEVFARNVDWFVGAALAREGRSNGYLTSGQDAVLAGFGSIIPPEVTRDGGEAMVRVLEEMTTLPTGTRDWFLETHGAARLRSPVELSRRVLESNLGVEALRPLAARAFNVRAPDASAEAVARAIAVGRGESCAGAVDPALAEARSRLVLLVADARSAGILRRRATSAERGIAQGVQVGWRSRALTGSPWEPTVGVEMRRMLRESILRSALAVDTRRGLAAVLRGTPLGVSTCQ